MNALLHDSQSDTSFPRYPTNRPKLRFYNPDDYLAQGKPSAAATSAPIEASGAVGAGFKWLDVVVDSGTTFEMPQFDRLFDIVVGSALSIASSVNPCGLWFGTEIRLPGQAIAVQSGLVGDEIVELADQFQIAGDSDVGVVRAHTDRVFTLSEAVEHFNRITRPASRQSVPIDFDPDDYPLF
jgi:hypothetical protein